MLPNSSQRPPVLDSCVLVSRTLRDLLGDPRPCSLRDRGVRLAGGRVQRVFGGLTDLRASGSGGSRAWWTRRLGCRPEDRVVECSLWYSLSREYFNLRVYKVSKRSDSSLSRREVLSAIASSPVFLEKIFCLARIIAETG